MPRKNTLETIKARLVLDAKGCHVWPLSLCHGYGQVTYDGKHWFVHRLLYEAARGAIPAGLELDHLCRNRACANVEHLEAVDRRTNILRGERGMRDLDRIPESVEFLSTAQVAVLLGVSMRRVQALITEDRLPAVRVGKNLIVRSEDLGKLELKPVGWPKGRPRAKG